MPSRHLCCLCPQLGVKALTYNDLIQAQKEISAHNQQLREQTEQLEKGNRELRSRSLQLVCCGGGRWGALGQAASQTSVRWHRLSGHPGLTVPLPPLDWAPPRAHSPGTLGSRQ